MDHKYTTNRFQGIIDYLKKIRIPSRVIFITVGILSTIWFLLRVIPKPSRAAYPCMKAAVPLASSFITYLIGIASFTFLFRKARERLIQSKYLLASVFILLGLSAGLVAIMNNSNATYALDMQAPQVGNDPVGEGKGVFPGRVVWMHDVDATDENCTNSGGDYWFQDDNTDTDVVKEMLSNGLQQLTGKSTDAEAWDAIIKNYNSTHGNGDNGYTAGEKIAIKINMNAIWGGDDGINTSPQVCYALLGQLINELGVAQTDISIGDPNISLTSGVYEKCHAAFPNVTYWGGGSTPSPQGTSSAVLFGSDGGFSNKIPQAYVDAAYLINIPVFKKHHRAGISISSKNHFGSVTPYTGSAEHLHYGLPVPDANEQGQEPNGEYGVYRCLVDIMGHKDLGGKTILHLVDGIWGSINWGHPAIKWEMTPFNNDWPNSLFLSMDPVAVQSVCFDFLYEEFDEDHPTEGIAFLSSSHGPFPHFPGTDDFLHQAASPDLWPTDFEYDPENDGSILTSLGTHEHWNNAIEKQYTRNLGTGEGIELIIGSSVPPPYGPTITMENSDLPSNQVNTLYIDSAMTVWIGTDAGLSRLTESGWKQYDTLLLSNGVNDFAFEYSAYFKSELWIATDSGLTVSKYNDIDGITAATTYVPANSPMVGHKVAAVTVDALHNRWVGTDEAVNVFQDTTWNNRLAGIDAMGDAFDFADFKITDIEVYADTLALISTMGKAINRMSYDLVDGFTGASTYGPPWSTINSENITAIDVNGAEQWYGTADTGAFFHASDLTKEDWTGYNTDSGMVDNLINTVVIDNDDNAWLGTPEGISIVIPDGGIFNYTEADGLINNSVNYLTTDISGNVWAATSGGIQWFSSRVGVQIALGIPEIISPEYGASDQEFSIDLSWTEITGATKYLVQVATDYTFENIVSDLDNVSTTTYTISNLDPETAYYWKVAAATSSMASAWAYPYTFTTKEAVDGIVNLGENEISIYPTPFNDYIMIESSEFTNSGILSIFSLDGKLELQQVMDKETNRINTNDLQDGMYILRIVDGNKIYSCKIVK